jgi:hypothetical protein
MNKHIKAILCIIFLPLTLIYCIYILLVDLIEWTDSLRQMENRQKKLKDKNGMDKNRR